VSHQCNDSAYHILTHAPALTGPSAVAPPTESANASSNCHPTLPKTNDLSLAFSYNQTGTIRAESTIDMINGIDLILTVFWSPNGDVEGALKTPDAHADCLWPIAMSNQSEATESDSGAEKMHISSGIAVMSAAGVLLVSMLL